MKKSCFKITLVLCFILIFLPQIAFANNIIYGDLDNNGRVDALDLTLMQRYITGIIENFSAPYEAADLNGDSTISSTDAVLLGRYILGQIDIFPVEEENTNDIIIANPVTANASDEARALLNFLYTIKGEKMLTGQMESGSWGGGPDSEMDYIYNVTGVLPALRGLDFIHEYDNHNVIQRSIDWWERGGIPSLMWHWGAPTVGEGYEASQATIDVEACLIPGTAENVAMWQDLERIANHLEVLRDANVPTLWRPFHEMEGAWFWYGKDGPEPFIGLWRTMFNYFVHERGLNNLIWVLPHTSAVNTDWYPGDEYVDLAGADIYGVGSEPLVDMYESLVAFYGDDIPLAYHENGVNPDPELAYESGVMWSWFMTWHTDWLHHNNTPQDLNYVYHHERTLTLEDMPDIMDYAGENDSVRVRSRYSGRGSVSRYPNIPFIEKGSNVQFTAYPAEGWLFETWSGDVDSSSNPITLSVNEITNVTAEFIPDLGTNLLVNGDFSDGIAYWHNYIFEDQGANADINVVNGECVIDIVSGGHELYHVQLIRPGIFLEEGVTYELSFEVYADSMREMFLKVGEDGGNYTQYFGDSFYIGTEKETISRIFTMNDSTDTSARLEFNVGLENINVYFDNISLVIVN